MQQECNQTADSRAISTCLDANESNPGSRTEKTKIPLSKPAPPSRPRTYDGDMNRVDFILAPEGGCLRIEVDGVPLEEHARRAELRSAKADRQEHLAGAYAGLTRIDAVRWPSRHFLGSPALPGIDNGTVLLGCDCGDWGCWPLTAQVDLTPTTVTWHHFRNEHRPTWNHTTLGPFKFNRPQYEASLQTTEAK